MQPSSLIFVAVVAIWVAFLLQHWVQRREAMATARSVDRFSEAIRLLERSPVIAATGIRPALADLDPASTPSPLVARPARQATGPAASPVPAGAATGPARPVRTQSVRPVRTQSVRRPLRQRLIRRVRGVAFLLTVLSVPLTIAGAVAGALPWLALAGSVAAVGFGVAALRYAAVRERTRARLDRSIYASMHPVLTDVATQPEPAAGDQGAGREARIDSTAEAPSVSRGERAASRAGLTGPTWSPRPVPPPTYTLKAPAPRPEPEPAPVVEAPEPVPAPLEAASTASAAAPRRAVGH